MTKVTRSKLKSYFETGDQPTEEEFIDVFDSTANLSGSNSLTGSLIISGSTSDNANGSAVNLHVMGDITSSGNIVALGDVIAKNYIVSSSITNITTQTLSGSTGFGDTADDTHDFTGNITASNNISASGILTAEGLLISDDATITDNLTVNGDIDLEGSIDVNGTTNLDVVDIDGAVDMASTLVVGSHITASGNISASGTIIANKIETDQLVSRTNDANTGLQFGSNTVIIEGNDVAIAKFTPDRIDLNLPVTASSDISASGIITAEGLLISDDATITDNLTVNGDIDLQGSIDVNGTTNLDVVDIDGAVDMALTLTVGSHITASGNISASGTIFASRFESAGASNEVISFNDNLNVTGHITSSGNISSSGELSAATVSDVLAAAVVAQIDNDEIPIAKLAEDAVTITAGTNLSNGGLVTLGGSITLNVDDAFIKNDVDDATTGVLTAGGLKSTTHITSSGNISASGTIIAAAAVLTTADINAGTIDGITSLTAGGNLDIGAHGFRAETFQSDIATGTAPFTVASTTTVTNLEAATVATITGLAPDTATTQATQGAITSLGSLTGLTVAGNITASGDMILDGKVTANSFAGIFNSTNGVFSGSGQIDHDSTTNFVANEHIDHSGVTMTAGDGLNGGGTIEATRTFSVDSGSILPYYSSSIFNTVSGDVSITAGGVATVTGAVTATALTAGAGLASGGTFTGATARTFSVDSASLAPFFSSSLNSFSTLGDISSSGILTGEGLVISDDASITDTLTVGTIANVNTTHITASGTIKASYYITNTNTTASAGTDLDTATEINQNAGIIFGTTDNVAKGIRLPQVGVVPIGTTYTIYNTSATTLKVYPGTNDKIFPLGDNASGSIDANASMTVTAFSADGWQGFLGQVVS